VAGSLNTVINLQALQKMRNFLTSFSIRSPLVTNMCLRMEFVVCTSVSYYGLVSLLYVFHSLRCSFHSYTTFTVLLFTKILTLLLLSFKCKDFCLIIENFHIKLFTYLTFIRLSIGHLRICYSDLIIRRQKGIYFFVIYKKSYLFKISVTFLLLHQYTRTHTYVRTYIHTYIHTHTHT
jgi:hypothetical protein